MRKYFPLLKTVTIFESIDEDQLDNMLGCLGAKTQTYSRNDIIFLADSRITSVGIILSGSAQIVKEDVTGNRTIMSKLSEGDMFGEAFACANVDRIPVTVLTTTGCEILFIQFSRIVTTCSSSCGFHTALIKNMLQLIAQKNILLNNRMDILAKRTTREKLMAYFSMQIKKCGRNKFKIPFSRDELADFLCVNRSALSRELCNMRDENLLTFNKNEFEIHRWALID
ncbi:transcriptional regulator FixK [Ruminiclostridium hungatei]|uniref:Transcriptional regulator FixK n=1 Tax=Ruminiclostridium hungatei TaxID=48256 RepID=A0A1V4SLG7_RUMHU|nr:Crp/Fnr family transcriptional regulator [Ruminiclostridium hungatei]OPX44097.1 transcriptional regulator FixK [Ruminiclostridium hungatei]